LGFITFPNVQVFFNTILNHVTITGNLAVALITVGTGGIDIGGSGPFTANGLSTLNGPTSFTNNVTFFSSIHCTTPLFRSNSFSDPEQFPCLLECPDFYNFYVATSASLAETNDTEEVFMGTEIDFVNNNSSLLNSFAIYANVSKEYSASFMEKVSVNYTNLLSLNRISEFVITPLDTTFFPSSSCLPLFSLTDNITSINYTVPFYDYSKSTCTSIQERYYLSNATTRLLGIVQEGGGILTRTCNGPNAVCTPFFNLFEKNIPFFEILQGGGTGISIPTYILYERIQWALPISTFKGSLSFSHD